MITKQVIVWRNDLKVRKGKLMAQAAHASMIPILNKMSATKRKYDITRKFTLSNDDPMEHWLSGSFTKVVVKCDSEEELLELLKQAEDAGLPCGLVVDEGRTEFNGVPTKTCIAIGPAEATEVDKITGKLGLL